MKGDSFQGKVVIVTGAATGIGAETCVHFADQGAQVILNHRGSKRSMANIEKVKARIAELGGKVEDYCCDCSDRAATFKMVEDLMNRYGRIDGIVCNAMAGIISKMEDFTEEQAKNMMNNNFFGAFWLTQAVLPRMREQGFGSILYISSSAFVNGGGGSVMYPASKGALEGLCHGLIPETASFGIRVNVIRPGSIETEIQRYRYDDEGWAKYCARQPMRRMGQPAEIAEAIVFLSDNDRASYITGQSLNVDGGRIHFFGK